MNIEEINQRLAGNGISVTGSYVHAKASEAYVEVEVIDACGTPIWNGAIPYQYRRTGLRLGAEQEIADYLLSVRDCFLPANVQEWANRERQYWDENFQQLPVTAPIFRKLLSMEWVYGHEFPLNPDGTSNTNPQRRIQDIKDKGYTVASKREGKQWKRKLLPLPRQLAHSYEAIKPVHRKRILEVLNAENVYELSTANRVGLIPDHKFPEIRWDADTPQENPVDISDEGIRAKFQLLDNQRNQQKREVCRRCFQNGERGTLFGINFFYAGGNRWDNAIPQTGAAAEQGCVGCGWYDIRAWRQALNSRIGNAPE